jgi:hypothetical protein
VVDRYNARVWTAPAARPRVKALAQLQDIPTGISVFVPRGVDQGQVAYWIEPEQVAQATPWNRPGNDTLRIARMNVSLRSLEDRDLDAIYQQVTDPESIRMAAFTAADPEHWRPEHRSLVHLRRVLPAALTP